MKYEELKDEIKAAMKAHDNVRRDILRQVHTELKAIEVNERREVTEADVDAMLKRVIKQTKETLEAPSRPPTTRSAPTRLPRRWRSWRGCFPSRSQATS